MTNEEALKVSKELQLILDQAIEEIKKQAIEKGCEFACISEWPNQSGKYLVNVMYE